MVFEPEATVVRRIFDDYVHGGHSLREIIRRLMSQAEETLRQAPTLVARMGVGKDSP